MRKKIRFRMLKRILILLLCTTLVSGSCLDRYKIEVHATSVAVSTEAGAEIMMALWNLVAASMVASGAGEFVANYDQEKPVFEKFMDVYGAFVGAPDNDYVTLEDGTVVSFSEFYEMYEIGTITIPDVDDWNFYRDRVEEDCDDPEDYILKTWNQDAMNAKQAAYLEGGGSSSEPPEPDDEPTFYKLKGLLLSSGLVAALTATMSSLWKGEIEGVDLSPYRGDLFTGYVTDNSGYYVYTASSTTQVVNGSFTKWELNSSYGNYLYKECLVFDSETSDGIDLYRVYAYANGALTDVPSIVSLYGDIYKDGLQIGTRNNAYQFCLGTIYENGVASQHLDFSVSMPIFSSLEAAEAYFKTGSLDGCINRIVVDYDTLASGLPAIMASKTGVQVSPTALQSMYARMKAAYQTQVKPQLETETDTDTNTDTYKESMTQAVTDTDPETDTDTGTDTDTDTETDPDTDEDTGTDTDTELDIDIQDYKVDLRQVFPFCIPFDLMALFGVLAADPVAPRFEIPFVVPSLGIEETYVIDLSFLDEQMVLLRKLELVGFIISLMLLTGKVIKW